MKYRALDQRYEVAVEVRNNLVAASQNIQGAQNYLSSVKFPYCAPPEVDTLNKVKYNDIMIQELTVGNTFNNNNDVTIHDMIFL